MLDTGWQQDVEAGAAAASLRHPGAALVQLGEAGNQRQADADAAADPTPLAGAGAGAGAGQRRGVGGGVGIGLSLVARFAELHQGRAWVTERRGGGASFHVLLPACVKHLRPVRTATPRPDRSRPAESVTARAVDG